jgi:hypothetical protein
MTLEYAIVSGGSGKVCRLCVEVMHGLRNHRKQSELSQTGSSFSRKARLHIMLDIIISHQPYPQEIHTKYFCVWRCRRSLGQVP